MKKPQKSSFVDLVEYLTNSQKKNHRVEEIKISNCKTDHLEAATAEILATQLCNTRAKNDKTYHLIISFRPGEHPSQATLKAVEEKICAGIGFSEHQRISVVHTDTDNLHIHVAINKIHPVKGTMFEPYQAYKKFAELCMQLEDEYGLEKDNHTPRRSLSEGKVQDMEKHSGIESLVTWIRRECLSEIQAAESWEALHRVMGENGLALVKQGNGLVIKSSDQSKEIQVKASTVSRDLSKKRLEDRLGAYIKNQHDQADQQNLKTQAEKKHYTKRPLVNSKKANLLYAAYQQDQAKLFEKRAYALKQLSKQYQKNINAIQRSKKRKRALIKLFDGQGINKKRVYQQEYSALIKYTKLARKKYQRERQSLYQQYSRQAWQDWLKTQALAGHADALAVLNAQNNQRTHQDERPNRSKRSNRHRNSRGIGQAGSIRKENPTTKSSLRQPHFKSVGGQPQAKTQHHLRNLSELDVVQFTQGGEVFLQGDAFGNLDQQRTACNHGLRRSEPKLDTLGQTIQTESSQKKRGRSR